MKKIYTLLFVISMIGTSLSAQIEGTWKLAQDDFALGVGPAIGDFSWWNIGIPGGPSTRECLFDDQYVFMADGTFQNVMDGSTWVEAWQGTDPEGCDTPVAPHDGSAAGTWTDNGDGTLTITGVGAHLGLPKVINGAEIDDPANAPASITYDFSIDGDIMTIDINFGPGFWHYILQKEGGGGGGNPQGLPLTFEDAATVDYMTFGFGGVEPTIIPNPDASGDNTSGNVLQLTKMEGAEVWGGTSLPLDGDIDFSTSTMMELKVWSPKVDAPIQLKIEDLSSPPDANGNPSIIAEVAVNTTVANAWETLTFDMSLFGAFDASNEYDQVVVFPDFGNGGATGGETFYVDDIQLSGDVAIDEADLVKVKMNAYPNPVSDVLTVDFDIPVAGEMTISLVDVLGRTAMTENFGNLNSGAHVQNVAVNSLSAGAYILLLEHDGQLIKTQHVVVR